MINVDCDLSQLLLIPLSLEERSCTHDHANVTLISVAQPYAARPSLLNPLLLGPLLLCPLLLGPLLLGPLLLIPTLISLLPLDKNKEDSRQ